MTFSIVALDKKTHTLGVATATGSTYVGNRVPHVKEGVGAIATQAETEISYGVRGLELLKSGYTPKEALEKLLSEDSKREHRQVIIIDKHGRKAAFTGQKNIDYKGHIIREDCVVAGNMLVNENVLKEMVRAFEEEKGELARKLLRALEAGKEAGGDFRGERSAALIVAFPKIDDKLVLKVNDHNEPIKELRKLLEQRLK